MELSALVGSFIQAVVDAPNRRPLALANVVASLMLVIGGFMLGIRSRSAQWFITNAVVANVAWIVTDAVIMVMQIEGWRGALSRRAMALIRATADPGPAASAATQRAEASALVTQIGAAFAVIALVKLIAHWMVLRRARSVIITAFVDEASED